MIEYLYLPKSIGKVKNGVLTERVHYYSCGSGSYYSGGRTNRGGRSNPLTQVIRYFQMHIILAHNTFFMALFKTPLETCFFQAQIYQCRLSLMIRP